MEIERVLPITNKYGLHARAATRLAQVAQKFGARIMISRQSENGSGEIIASEEVDAKSVLGLLSLGAECGDSVRVSIDGDDASAALDELTSLLEQKFHED